MVVLTRTSLARSNIDQRWESSGSILQLPPARKLAGFDATRSIKQTDRHRRHTDIIRMRTTSYCPLSHTAAIARHQLLQNEGSPIGNMTAFRVVLAVAVLAAPFAAAQATTPSSTSSIMSGA